MFGMVTLRVGGLVIAGGAFSERDAESDGDPLGPDEDVFDQQSQHALAFLDGGGLGVGAELGEEAVEVGGELEVVTRYRWRSHWPSRSPWPSPLE